MPAYEHEHHCPDCGIRWSHAPERPCLAATRYRCPPCTETPGGAEARAVYEWEPPPQRM